MSPGRGFPGTADEEREGIAETFLLEEVPLGGAEHREDALVSVAIGAEVSLASRQQRMEQGAPGAPDGLLAKDAAGESE